MSQPNQPKPNLPDGMQFDDGRRCTLDQLLHLSSLIWEHLNAQDGRPLLMLTLGTLRRVPNLHVSFQEFLTLHHDAPDGTMVLLDHRGVRVEQVN